KGGSPQVGVDQTDAGAGLGGHDSEVRDRRRLPFARTGGGEHDRTTRLVDAGEMDIGPQRAICLRGGGVRAPPRDEGGARPAPPAPHRLLPGTWGTRGMPGSRRCCSTPSGALNVRSKTSSPPAAPSPSTSPATTLRPRFQNVRGRMGTLGAVALSTSRMLFVSSPPVTAVSFRRLATES